MARRIPGLLLAAALVFPAGARAGDAAPLPAGPAELTADLGGTPLTVFTDKPAGCRPTGLLLVFHGVQRDAAAYREHALALRGPACLIVAAPLFDKARFPRWRYQEGGIVHGGRVEPPESRTGRFVLRLVDWLRDAEAAPALPYALVAHSAGAQFLGRLAAFVPNEARRIVLANPSTYVRARLDVDAPFGFGLIYPDDAAAEAALRRYLAAPVTVLLGTADTGTKNLARSAPADAQGATRHERGLRMFEEARAAAARHGWPFGWRLAEVPGVGHDAARMLASPQARAALGG